MSRIAIALMGAVLVACWGSSPPAAIVAPVAPPRSAGLVVLASHRVNAAHLAADSGGVYWTEGNEDASTVVYLEAPVTARPPIVAVRVTGAITALAIDRDAIYFAISPTEGDPEIRRADRHGGHPTTVAVTGAAVERMVVDRGDVFWGEGGGQIRRTGKTGPVTLADNVEYSYLNGFAVDGDAVLFSNELDDTPNRINRVPRQGGDVVRVDDAAGVDGWTAIGGAVYYSAADAVWKVATSAPAETRVSLGRGRLASIPGADRLFVYENDALHTRPIAGGPLGPILPLGDAVRDAVFASGALWFVRDDDPDDPSPEIVTYGL